MSGPQFDDYAVPADLAVAPTTPDEELGQTGGQHRRPTRPRFGPARGRVETVAVSAVVLTLVLIGITHRPPDSANGGAPVREMAAPASSRSVIACRIARDRPATGGQASANHGSHRSGIVRTDIPHCPTEAWRAAQSAYLARLLAQQTSANACPAGSRPLALNMTSSSGAVAASTNRVRHAASTGRRASAW